MDLVNFLGGVGPVGGGGRNLAVTKLTGKNAFQPGKNRTTTPASKKGSEKVLVRVPGKGSQEGSQEGS